MTFTPCWLCILTAAAALGPALAADEARLSAGPYAVRLAADGLVVTHDDTVVCHGATFTAFKPQYQGAVLTLAEAFRAGTLEVAEDGRSLKLHAELPEGALSYEVVVSEQAVRTVLRARAAEGAVVGPVEYPAFMLPPDVVEGATLTSFRPDGEAGRLAVPREAQRGGMAPATESFAIATAQRTVTVSTTSAGGVYPFDARVPQYGAKQGIWAFMSPPVGTEFQTIVEAQLQVTEPPPAQTPGKILLGKDTEVSAVGLRSSQDAREAYAADELVSYLDRISGKRLETVLTTEGGVAPGTLLVGQAAVDAGIISQSELDDLALDGYIVRVADGRAGICGRRSLGTVYGVYALLRELGVRFYAPGCEVLPRTERLVIGDCSLRAQPFYEFRAMTGNLKLGHTPGDDMGNPREIGESGNIVHSADYLVPFDKYVDEHPEYFALQKDGKRLHRDPEGRRFDVHLCLSNPDVRRISAQRMLELIEKQPDRMFFGVSQGDGFAWCECEQCRALDAVPGVEMTDRLLDYVNYVARAVAEKYPDKRILTLAYTNATSPPPTKVMPEPNVMVQFCPYPHRVACQSHGLTCPKNAVGFADLQGWIAGCPDNMYIFDYPRGYAVYYEPFGSFYAMRDKLAFYAQNNIRGIYYCGVPTNFKDLFVYVNSRLLWEPGADVEALIDEFMAAYYGAAAPRMRQYFDLLARETEERPVHQMCEGANPGLVTAEYADRAEAIFTQARAAVADDRFCLYRVGAEEFCWLFADLNERNPVRGNLAVSEERFATRLARFLEIGRKMRIQAVLRGDNGGVEDFLYKVARIRPKTRPWYADPLVDAIPDNPQEALRAHQQLFSQTAIEGGWLLELDGFLGCKGPQEYSHECEPRTAVWIYGTNTANPAMWVNLGLETAPEGEARLILVAQDDDKPGAVRLGISVNGQSIFEGENPFAERGWSEGELTIPAGVLKAGRNEIRFSTLDESAAADAGWFMLAECKLLTR